MLQSSLVLALAGLASFSSAAPTAVKRGGGKRGLAFAKDNGDKANMFTPGGKVSWAYDWEACAVNEPRGFTVPGVEYVPMLHDGGGMFTGVFKADLQGAYDAGARHVLSINEPDICGEGKGGACMDVESTVKVHREYIDKFAKKHPDLTVVSPAYSNDGVEVMKEFLARCDDCRIDHIATHWYGPATDLKAFKEHVKHVHELTKKPIWVTEFASYENDEHFLKEAIAWLDKTDYVYRYAYWSVETALTNGMSLSPLGNAFANA